MSNKYLKELGRLNRELEQMAPDEIFRLFGGVEIDLEDAKKHGILERYITESEPKNKTNFLEDVRFAVTVVDSLNKELEQGKKDAAIHRTTMNGQIKMNRKEWAVVEFLRNKLINNAGMLSEDSAEFVKHIDNEIQKIMALPDVEKDYDPK
jgi:hypothetical protein